MPTTSVKSARIEGGTLYLKTTTEFAELDQTAVVRGEVFPLGTSLAFREESQLSVEPGDVYNATFTFPMAEIPGEELSLQAYAEASDNYHVDQLNTTVSKLKTTGGDTGGFGGIPATELAIGGILVGGAYLWSQRK